MEPDNIANERSDHPRADGTNSTQSKQHARSFVYQQPNDNKPVQIHERAFGRTNQFVDNSIEQTELLNPVFNLEILNKQWQHVCSSL